MYRGWLVQRGLFLCGIITSVGWFMAGQFVSERKKKKVPSVSTMVLREQYAQEMGDILQIIPGIMHELANIQSVLLTHIYAFFDGDKQCFLLSAKKDQLYDSQTKLTVHKQRSVVIKQTLHELLLFLQSLELEQSKSSKATKHSMLI